MAAKKIIIFGGSGFLGRSITNLMLKNNYHVSVVCQDYLKAQHALGVKDNLNIITGDIFDQSFLLEQCKDKDVIINLIGKLYEKQPGDFLKFHYKLVKNIIGNITNKQHFIHVSALGIEESFKESLYAQSKLKAELDIIEQCSNYNIIKPSIVFGETDNFFNFLAKILKKSPIMPIIGGGLSKFAPVYVEDISKSIDVIITHNKKHRNKIFEAYGEKISTFKEILQFILKILNKKRLLMPLPYSIAMAQANIMNLFKIYSLTSDNVKLLKYDNIGSDRYPNIDSLIGKLSDYENIVPKYIDKK